MLKPYLLLLVTLFSTSVLAATPSLRTANAKARSFAKAQKGNTYVVSLDSTTTPDGLQVACPLGLYCPSDKYSLKYRASGSMSNIRLFFKTTQMDSLKSVEDFKRDFSLTNFEVQLQKKLKLEGYRVSVETVIREGSLESGQSVTLTSFDGKKLTGELVSPVKFINITRDDAWAKRNCMAMDAPLPKRCGTVLKVNFPIKVKFSLNTELKPLDCRTADGDDNRCGK